jgi:hypothetical protein
MKYPENGRGPEPKPEANATATSNDSTAIMDRPSTTRTCGSSCWCRTGDWVVPYPHWQYMDTLAREIRTLEIAEGVLAL